MAGVEASKPIHPFIPEDLILPDYVPMVLSQSTILGGYVGASILVVTFVWILAGMYSFNFCLNPPFHHY